MVLRGVADTHWRYPPYDLDCPDRPLLHARLLTTEEVLVAWAFDDVAAETCLEELHTASELVLEECVNQRSKRMSFAQLVEAAEAAGLFTVDPDDVTPPALLLTNLKNLRKDVRHRAATGSDTWLRENCEDVAMLLERLVARLKAPGGG